MCLNGLLIKAEYEFCKIKYRFAEKNVELSDVKPICLCSEKGEKIKSEAISVNTTTAEDAGSNRRTLRAIKFRTEIVEVLLYSVNRDFIMTYPLITKNTSTPIKPP
jgi:hypothetical protein